MTDDLAERLCRRLSTLWGSEVTIRDLQRLTGGASRETWACTAHPADGPARRLVLRRDPPGDTHPETMRLEAAVLRAAAEAGVPVPALVDHASDETVLGTPYLLTEHVAGETIPRRLLRDPAFDAVRPTLAVECGRVLARIHRIPLAAISGLPRPDPLDSLMDDYDELHEPMPAVELALLWLRDHRPEPVADTVVHGDFRNGNLIVRPDGLRAVLDWELVHRGDPREDLGWLCVKAWRFGSPLPVGGFGTREELFDGYAEIAGTRPDPTAVHWWEVHRTAWWAMGCRRQAERHLSGLTRSVELAAVGRRACEQEHDLLDLLDVPTVELPEPVPALPSDLYGHPSAGELVEAVREFLNADLLPTLEGRLKFLTRVASGVLSTVERELSHGPDATLRHHERLAALGFPGQAEFAAALRAGTANPADPAVLAAVRADVTERLLATNPKYPRG